MRQHHFAHQAIEITAPEGLRTDEEIAVVRDRLAVKSEAYRTLIRDPFALLPPEPKIPF